MSLFMRRSIREGEVLGKRARRLLEGGFMERDVLGRGMSMPRGLGREPAEKAESGDRGDMARLSDFLDVMNLGNDRDDERFSGSLSAKPFNGMVS